MKNNPQNHENEISHSGIEKALRIGKFADKPGNYELVIRLQNPIVDPGDILKLEVFITGYGLIRKEKLVFYPSVDLFDNEKSKIRFGIGRKKDKPNLFIFGTQERKLKDVGITIGGMGGIKKENWKEYTIFFDIVDSKEVPQISTETKQECAPVELDLKVSHSARAGIYYLSFNFSYFNGEQWKGSSKEVAFTIRNVLQRNETLAAFLAIFAATATICVGLKTFYPLLKDLIRSILNQIKG